MITVNGYTNLILKMVYLLSRMMQFICYSRYPAGETDEHHAMDWG
jgi:hypothetical protein